MYRGLVTDFDTTIKPGHYSINSEVAINAEPKGAYRYGTLLVAGSMYLTQIYITDYYGIIYKRERHSNGSWRGWCNFEGVNL